MRDNDLLDGAWEAPEEPKPAPRAWQRTSCRDLDRVFGVVSGSHEDDDLFVPVRPPTPQPQTQPKPKPKATKPRAKPAKRKRRAKATIVHPEDAEALLRLWVKKLLLARERVQKYRAAVRRYKAQGRI